MGVPMGNSVRQTGRGPGSSWSHPVALSAVRARLPPHPLPSRGQVLCSSGSLGSSHLQGWLPAARTGLFWAQPLVVQPGKARGLTPGITLNQGGVGLVDVSMFRGCCNTILSAGWRETKEMSFLPVLEARSLESGCWQGLVPSKCSGGRVISDSSSFWLLPAFLGLWLYHSSLCLSPHLAFLLFYCVSKEKAMAPYSSTLAWKIPWMEKPGRLPSMGSLRVGHD